MSPILVTQFPVSSRCEKDALSDNLDSPIGIWYKAKTSHSLHSSSLENSLRKKRKEIYPSSIFWANLKILTGKCILDHTAKIFNVIFTVFKCVPIFTVISLYGLHLIAAPSTVE